MRPASGAVGAVTIVATLCTGALASACGTQSGVGSTALPPLRLTDVAGQSRALGMPEPASGGAGSPYVLRTTLPSGTPAPAAVWRLSKPSAADAARVASALGVTSGPAAVHGGRVARAGSHLLTVRDDGSWSWGIDCMPDVPLDKESLQVACSSAVTTSPAPSPGPTVSRARELADPILRQLGWADGTITVTPGSPATTVTARRSVGGVDTADWLTSLSFTVGEGLDAANGWSVEPVRGRVYPLVDAAAAFKTLQTQPRPLPLLCRVRTDGRPGCEPVGPLAVTAARLGLALRHEGERALLVPAWLFDISGSTQPAAVVAVAPSYLATPTPVPMGTPDNVASAEPAAPASPVPAASAGGASSPRR